MEMYLMIKKLLMLLQLVVKVKLVYNRVIKVVVKLIILLTQQIKLKQKLVPPPNNLPPLSLNLLKSNPLTTNISQNPQ